jgi:hypothetical protein
MATQLTAEDAKQSLTTHVETKGVDAFVKHGAPLDRETLERLLADRALVRYPCEIVFDAAQLLPGEFAHPLPKGEQPEEGFTLCVHPYFEHSPAHVAYAALYVIVVVNYGEFASHDEAETFGAAALGLTRDEYYEQLCAMSDQVGGVASDEEPLEPAAHSCGSGCGCH